MWVAIILGAVTVLAIFLFLFIYCAAELDERYDHGTRKEKSEGGA